MSRTEKTDSSVALEVLSEEQLRLLRCNDVRDSYLDPREVDIVRLKHKISGYPGFAYVDSAEPNGEGQLDWTEKVQDFSDWRDLVLHLIVPTVDESDIIFHPKMVAYFEAYLADPEKSNSFFAALHDREIKVTAAHTGTTPFEHTLNVVGELITQRVSLQDALSDLEPKRNPDDDIYQRLFTFRLRLAALLHDLGKRFGAVGDDYQDHARFSAIIASEFNSFLLSDQNLIVSISQKLGCDKSLLSQSLADIPFLIRYHHLPELGDYFVDEARTQQVLTIADVKQLTKGKVSADFSRVLQRLCHADVCSVKRYSAFLLTITVQLEDSIAELIHLLNGGGGIQHDQAREQVIGQAYGIAQNLEEISKSAQMFSGMNPTPVKFETALATAQERIMKLLGHLQELAANCPSFARPILQLLIDMVLDPSTPLVRQPQDNLNGQYENN